MKFFTQMYAFARDYKAGPNPPVEHGTGPEAEKRAHGAAKEITERMEGECLILKAKPELFSELGIAGATQLGWYNGGVWTPITA